MYHLCPWRTTWKELFIDIAEIYNYIPFSFYFSEKMIRFNIILSSKPLILHHCHTDFYMLNLTVLKSYPWIYWLYYLFLEKIAKKQTRKSYINFYSITYSHHICDRYIFLVHFIWTQNAFLYLAAGLYMLFHGITHWRSLHSWYYLLLYTATSSSVVWLCCWFFFCHP